tara:strand:+ start:2947 stop:3138 length:192 start_codon:yes stop_codon:yes gene_type:complete
VNIFLGDEITLTKQTAWVTGKVNGVKLDKGHLQMVSLEHVELWLRIDEGWRIVDDSEEVHSDD